MKLSTVFCAAGLCAGAAASEFCCAEIDYKSGPVYKYIPWTGRTYSVISSPSCVANIAQSKRRPSQGGCADWVFAASPLCDFTSQRFGRTKESKFCS
ncbi:hypothetical protein E4U53_000184 [Claviceps sorghi]|nr:hypothetical protein E4U53_000184 [Claviceps sorghi]